jgi:hypothetical protein
MCLPFQVIALKLVCLPLAKLNKMESSALKNPRILSTILTWIPHLQFKDHQLNLATMATLVYPNNTINQFASKITPVSHSVALGTKYLGSLMNFLMSIPGISGHHRMQES